MARETADGSQTAAPVENSTTPLPHDDGQHDGTDNAPECSNSVDIRPILPFLDDDAVTGLRVGRHVWAKMGRSPFWPAKVSDAGRCRSRVRCTVPAPAGTRAVVWHRTHRPQHRRPSSPTASARSAYAYPSRAVPVHSVANGRRRLTRATLAGPSAGQITRIGRGSKSGRKKRAAQAYYVKFFEGDGYPPGYTAAIA